MLTDFHKEQLKEMAAAGMTPEEIADELVISLKQLYREAKALGVAMRPAYGDGGPQRDHIFANLEEISRDYYERGLSLEEIEEIWHITRGAWYAAMAEAGLKPRSRTLTFLQGREAQVDHALALYQEGWKVQKIYLETGISPGKLYLELHRRDIPLRRAG